MTAASVTQSAIYALAGGEQPAKVTQSALYALAGGEQPGKVTQSALYALAGQAQPAFVTQSALYALAYRQPCVSRMAQCWRIARRDGVVYAFTAHDQPISWRGDTYQPCGALSASAYQNSGEMGQVGNTNLTGLLALLPDDAGIAAVDLAAGLLDGAEVQVWELPWDDSTELPLPVMRGYVGKVSLHNATYEGEVITLSSLMNERGLIETYSATCRYTLGDARCGVDLHDFTAEGAVTGRVAGNVRTMAARRQFFDTARGEAAGYWQNGVLTWTGGANAGFSSEIAANDVGVVSLWNAMPNDIAEGDTYEIVAGCDKTPGTCFGKFANIANFGGFPDIPGNDVVMQTPDAKQ